LKVEQLKEEISEYQKGEKQGFPLTKPARTEEVAACSLQVFSSAFCLPSQKANPFYVCV